MRSLALIAVAVLIPTGCGWGLPSSMPPQPTDYPVVVHSPIVMPSDRHGSPGIPTESAQFVSATSLRIVTLGSSSCPSVPDELIIESVHSIRIHLVVGSWLDGQAVAHPPPGGVCTDDYGETAMVVPIDPSMIDVHSPLTVRFFYNESKEPEVRTAAPLTSQTPHYPVVVRSPIVFPVSPTERARLHIRGFAQFVSPTRLAIVTWGSGSCPHVPDKLVIRSPNSIEVELAMGTRVNRRLLGHLPDHAICTADLRTTAMLLAIDPKLIDAHRPLTVLGLQRGVVRVAPLKS